MSNKSSISLWLFLFFLILPSSTFRACIRQGGSALRNFISMVLSGSFSRKCYIISKILGNRDVKTCVSYLFCLTKSMCLASLSRHSLPLMRTRSFMREFGFTICKLWIMPR
jgi:hypothetical protein